MRILILGAAGFIGKNLIIHLLKQEENELLLFDREQVDYGSIVRDDEDRISYFYGDFNAEYDFNTLTRDVDVVYHLVSTSNPSTSKSVFDDMRGNVLPTINLLDACTHNKVKKVVFLSSGGTVYGVVKNVPISEMHERNPICPYGIQKLTIEKIIEYYGYQFGLDYRIIRLANPYGPYQNPMGGLGAVTTFIYKMLTKQTIEVYGDGEVVRDYIYIEDAINGILKIVEGNTTEKIFNLGGGRGYSINEIITVLNGISKNKMDVAYKSGRNVDVPVNVLDTSRFERYYGKSGKFSLQEGISRTIEFIKNNYEF